MARMCCWQVMIAGLVAWYASGVTPAAQGGRPAAPLSVLATNAIQGPLLDIAGDLERRTGQQLRIEFDTSPSINRRFLAGQIAGVDVLIAAAGTVDQAIKDGKALGDSRAALGRVGVGVAIRQGARRPDLSSVASLKASLLQADAVVYSQGASGVYVEKLLQSLGLMDQLKGRTVQLTTGADMIERVQASRGNEIGMTQVSEITRAVEETGGAIVLAGPLPAAVQNYTAFDAVVMSASADAGRARAFVRTLVAPEARKALAANAWEF